MARNSRRGRGSKRETAREKMQRRRRRNKEDSSGNSSKYIFEENVDYFNPKPRTYSLLIVPYEITVNNNPDVEKGDTMYNRQIHVHYNIGIENSSVICLKTVGKRCPICEYRDQLIAESWDDNESEIKALRASKREIFNVIDLDDDVDTILFWEIAYANFGELLDEELDSVPEDSLLFGLGDVEDRPVLRVRFKEDRFGSNKFVVATKIEIEDGGDVDDELVAAAIDLDRCLNILKYDDLKKMFLQIDDPEGGVEPEPERESRSRRARSRNRSQSDKNEDDSRESRSRRSRSRNRSQSDKNEDDRKEGNSTGDDVPEYKEGNQTEDSSRRSRSRSRQGSSSKNKKNPCPAGWDFGTDCDKKDECTSCEKWNDCMDRAEEIENGENVPF